MLPSRTTARIVTKTARSGHYSENVKRIQCTCIIISVCSESTVLLLCSFLKEGVPDARVHFAFSINCFCRYMQVNCAPSCQTCDKISFESRCPLDTTVPDVWGPGDLDQMFQRIITLEEFKKYEPRVVSRPEPKASECTSPKASPPHKAGEEEEPQDYETGPWAVIFDNFATPEECERLIELGHQEGYERSSDVGERQFDGSYSSNVNSGRTSTNAWCQHECYEDPLAKQVIEKITNLTGIPEANSEYLQLLKYEPGQYYQTHSDYIPHQVERQSGVRLLTMYLYLNDVEEGGGTEFPELGLTVTPKRGRAVIWPSVLDEDPNQKDPRTIHTALPVIKGVKYGANAWVHMRDFKTPNNKGCT